MGELNGKETITRKPPFIFLKLNSLKAVTVSVVLPERRGWLYEANVVDQADPF